MPVMILYASSMISLPSATARHLLLRYVGRLLGGHKGLRHAGAERFLEIRLVLKSLPDQHDHAPSLIPRLPQPVGIGVEGLPHPLEDEAVVAAREVQELSLIHISEPTRRTPIS